MKPQKYIIDKCPYCNSKVEYKDSSIIYSKSYGMIYICSNYPSCDAYVGVHKGTSIALGRLANDSLRKLKKEAHLYFDTMWKHKLTKGDHRARIKAYKWLSEEMNIERNKTHIGYFDEEQCRKVINLCKPWYCKIKKSS